MTNVFLFPNIGEPDELLRVAQPAGLTVHTPSTVRDYILQTHGENVAVVMIAPAELLVLQRQANTLVDILPTVVMSCPGLLYTHEWSGVAATFPAMDFMEFRDKFRKSGSTAFNPEDMTARHAHKDLAVDLAEDPGEGEI